MQYSLNLQKKIFFLILKGNRQFCACVCVLTDSPVVRIGKIHFSISPAEISGTSYVVRLFGMSAIKLS